MTPQLNPVEARVLGALIEKEMTTPEYYPMSVNALVNACNQKSNRDPVVSYDEDTVQQALEGLREKRLAYVITGREVRVPKYAHRISETWNLGTRELAVLQVLLLRGPQTVGELKQRADRAHAFDDLESVEFCLKRLMEWTPEPLAMKVARTAGTREPRYAHLLCGEVMEEAAVEEPPPRLDRFAALEAEVAALREKVMELQRALENFRRQFE
ncbi:MAG: YceH family protein [Candidatus Solibacter usitatus]|nr:YceH family protein [Candidatus Solibacter usitatus]